MLKTSRKKHSEHVYSILSDLPTDVEGATTACRRKWGGCTTRGTVQAAPGTSAPPRRYLDAHGPARRLRPRGRSDQALCKQWLGILPYHRAMPIRPARLPLVQINGLQEPLL